MVLFSIPAFVWSAALILHEGKQNPNTAPVTATAATEMFLSRQTGLQVCVPSTPVQTYSEILQRYVRVQKLTKSFLKTQNKSKV